MGYMPCIVREASGREMRVKEPAAPSMIHWRAVRDAGAASCRVKTTTTYARTALSPAVHPVSPRSFDMVVKSYPTHAAAGPQSPNEKPRARRFDIRTEYSHRSELSKFKFKGWVCLLQRS